MWGMDLVEPTGQLVGWALGGRGRGARVERGVPADADLTARSWRADPGVAARSH